MSDASKLISMIRIDANIWLEKENAFAFKHSHARPGRPSVCAALNEMAFQHGCERMENAACRVRVLYTLVLVN